MGIEANRRWGVCTLNEFRKVCDVTLLRSLPKSSFFVLAVPWP
jgi:hypothetical protein